MAEGVFMKERIDEVSRKIKFWEEKKDNFEKECRKKWVKYWIEGGWTSLGWKVNIHYKKENSWETIRVEPDSIENFERWILRCYIGHRDNNPKIKDKDKDLFETITKDKEWLFNYLKAEISTCSLKIEELNNTLNNLNNNEYEKVKKVIDLTKDAFSSLKAYTPKNKEKSEALTSFRRDFINKCENLLKRSELGELSTENAIFELENFLNPPLDKTHKYHILFENKGCGFYGFFPPHRGESGTTETLINKLKNSLKDLPLDERNHETNKNT